MVLFHYIFLFAVEITSCRSLLDKVVNLIMKTIHYGNQLFHIPRSLHDNVMEDNAIVKSAAIEGSVLSLS